MNRIFKSVLLFSMFMGELFLLININNYPNWYVILHDSNPVIVSLISSVLLIIVLYFIVGLNEFIIEKLEKKYYGN